MPLRMRVKSVTESSPPAEPEICRCGDGIEVLKGPGFKAFVNDQKTVTVPE